MAVASAFKRWCHVTLTTTLVISVTFCRNQFYCVTYQVWYVLFGQTSTEWKE